MSAGSGDDSTPPARPGDAAAFPGVFSVPPGRGESTPPSPHLLAGRYQLGEEIGRGALGVVHRGRDVKKLEPVALKLLHEVAQDGSTMDALIREVTLVRELTHPAVCRVRALAAHEGRPFLAMELLEGPTLEAYLSARGGSLPLEEVLELMAPVAEALDEAHDKRIVHLDLKPGNLQFSRPRTDPGSRLKVLDFGLARPIRSTLGGEAARAAGSPAYRAPEQARGERARAPADVYALAATIHEMLRGAPPFAGRDLEPDAPPRPPPPVLGMPSGVNQALATALSREPALRQHRAGDLIDDLRRAQRGPWRWLALLIVAVALMAALVAGK